MFRTPKFNSVTRFVCLILSVALFTACERRPIYRANAKLFVSTVGGVQTAEFAPENDNVFYDTAIAVMRSQTLLQRVQQRIHKSPSEMRAGLSGLKVVRAPGADLLLVTVDSTACEFARDAANALVDEYVKYFDEQRAQKSAEALQPFAQEVQRLGQELKRIKEKLRAGDNPHGVAANSELPGLNTLNEDRERINALYNIAVTKLYEAETSHSRNTRSVLVLEYAIIEPRPVNRVFFWHH